MTIHFEDLWEKCEQLQQESSAEADTQLLIDEIMMKFNLFKMIDSNKDIPEDERKKVKSRTIGEILLTITSLSFKENVNVFEALNTAYNYRAIKHYHKKYDF